MNERILAEMEPSLLNRAQRICERCIMDTSDPGIRFDRNGICNRCRSYERYRHLHLPPAGRKDAMCAEVVAAVKREGRNKTYDCIVGVSGGVDSTYVLYAAKLHGLRPLAIHLDNGWDSALAVSNIERCTRHLGVDLYTHVLDWDEFKDLQLSFLRASTPDSEIPTDHAIVASLYQQAERHSLKYVLFGVNTVTEGMAVPTWSYGHADWRYIKAVHREFGTRPIRSFPHISLMKLMWYRHVRRIRFIDFLDYLDYDKERAQNDLVKIFGWERYEGKHHESVYTRFFQSFILPTKFGADKRRVHLSTLIMSGQITRAAALAAINEPVASAEQIREDKIYVCKKLGLKEVEFDALMAAKPACFWDYPSYEKLWPVRLMRRFRGSQWR